MPIRSVRAFLAAVTLVAIIPAANAQSPDTLVRLNQLEEQVRQLNGRIEEMNFFILQMQEDMRRQKEDNEFRFQDLEGGAQSGTSQRGDAGEAPSIDDRSVASVDNETVFNEPEGSGNTKLGTPPRDLGTLTLPKASTDLELDPTHAGDEVLVAAIDGAATHQALYDAGYQFALSGDHARAEQIFRVHQRRYPDAPSAAQATYWLGESLLALNRPEEAAEVLLDGHNEYPDTPFAADMLMKVGVAMGRLGNRDLACATFDEVEAQYPNIPPRTSNDLTTERAQANC